MQLIVQAAAAQNVSQRPLCGPARRLDDDGAETPCVSGGSGSGAGKGGANVTPPVQLLHLSPTSSFFQSLQAIKTSLSFHFQLQFPEHAITSYLLSGVPSTHFCALDITTNFIYSPYSHIIHIIHHGRSREPPVRNRCVLLRRPEPRGRHCRNRPQLQGHCQVALR
jgi:hypothetical protein